MTTTTPTVVARVNNVHRKATCAFCDMRDRESWLDLYDADASHWAWVCHSCAADIAPDLAAAVAHCRDSADSAVDLFADLFADLFGDDWPDPLDLATLRLVTAPDLEDDR